MTDRFAVILAAGKGTRMKSKLYKVLHQVCGRAMVDHVLTQVEAIAPTEVVTIVGFGSNGVQEVLEKRTEYAFQEEQLGTAHAVLQAEDILRNKAGTTLVISGDTPLFTAQTLDNLFTYHEQNQAAATVLTAQTDNPFGYGRVIREQSGQVTRIVEQKDASQEEQAVQEINTGVYCFDNQKLFEYLHQVNNDNAQGEYYLPDVIGLMQSKSDKVLAYKMSDFTESLGVNDRVALAKANQIMQKRINVELMRSGVTLLDPDNTTIDITVEVGSDTVIEPNVVLKGKTVIGSDCYITSGSRIVDSQLADDVCVTSSTINQAMMHSHSNIGPNSHLRPKAQIGEYVHVGNFCEIKNAVIGARTKIGHLSYVGDATIGSDVNIGCGVVFVNYDGVQKFHSEVGNQVFIGSNSNIVSPVKIADQSFVAAGSTITQDVAKHDMAIARSRQVNKNDYWSKLPIADDPDWN